MKSVVNKSIKNFESCSYPGLELLCPGSI